MMQKHCRFAYGAITKNQDDYAVDTDAYRARETPVPGKLCRSCGRRVFLVEKKVKLRKKAKRSLKVSKQAFDKVLGKLIHTAPIHRNQPTKSRQK
jgi:hypothetical protein